MGNSYITRKDDFEKAIIELLKYPPIKLTIINDVICFITYQDDKVFYKEIEIKPNVFTNNKYRLFSCVLSRDKKHDRELIDSVYAPTDHMDLALDKMGYWLDLIKEAV
jgi:hypothetical protein